MADAPKNPFVSLSLCVVFEKKCSIHVIFMEALVFGMLVADDLIKLYLVFWCKYYKIWTKLSKSGFLPSGSHIGALGRLESLLMNSPRYNVQSNPVNMGTEGGIDRVRFINRVSVLSGSFL